MTDYSEIKLLYEAPGFSDKVKSDIIANANIQLNHEPNKGGMPFDTIRSYGAGLSYELISPNFLETDLLRGSSAPITLSFSGSVSRLEDTERTIAIAQMKFAIPFLAGLNLPISFSYASATETDSDAEFRVTVGTGLNLDHLAALTTYLLTR